MRWTNLVAACGFMALAGGANAASSVDESLEEIAGQIVERTRTDGTATIGISTFTHSDGTCSDLSNYISEFIVDSLFNAGAGTIDIIERSQLSAIFREMELVFDGTIAPDAAKRLGEIEGVDALVTGSLIQFGEQVKVQARMISTQDGRLFATARSEFPSVGSVAQMMATRSRGACGFAEAAGSGEDTPTTQVVVVEGGGTAQAAQAGLTAPSRRFTGDVFEAEVTRLFAGNDGKVNVVLRFKNTSERKIALAYVDDSYSMTDQLGRALRYGGGWKGIPMCRLSMANRCTGADPAYATVIPSGNVAQLRFVLEGEKTQDRPKLTLSMDLIVTPDILDTGDYSVKRINFFDMEPDS
ncbi:FlgO family outer membrane protein [Roseovarius atlanticus]|uniref:FlgO family outer membrane protein n=1 Tax=Roseovarius atlanticus TaxID=1641875 RepID=UPI001C98BDB8|nr:FlgO family outer membrane protein [Roseovarius atlanticus]MBY5989799.1 CsgG/HfaB family protein [Roseovarius atlanticus]MBY6126344.1 CsgG/HfaB family protein [Roseovarius atlanticus]MBY6150838.1 CsgG/HfaB family protein [Roseovarius atlanticus]